MDTDMRMGGASPALHGSHLIVNWDHEGASMLHALDKATGQTLVSSEG